MRLAPRSALIAFAGLSALVSACAASSAAPQPTLPQVSACFVTDTDTTPVTLEVASSFRERQDGLMGRESLGQLKGMLFQYPELQRPDRGFWMYRTQIPLDIAYLDDQGTIGSIRQMTPCASRNPDACPSYPAGVAFSAAVEMNQGFFAEHRIAVGDRLFTGPCPAP